MPIKIDQLTDFGNLEFLAKQAVEGFITGLHKSPYNGFSVEFAEHSQSRLIKLNFGLLLKMMLLLQAIVSAVPAWRRTPKR